MTKLEGALSYAARGWMVLPMHSVTDSGSCSCGAPIDYWPGSPLKHAIGKSPYIEHGHRFASNSPTQIERWWDLWPNANVAIATGLKSKIIVLDVDKKNGGIESLAALERRYGLLPKTPRVLSGGGGYHYYFLSPGFEVRGRRDMKKGIDVMADGSRIVAPPSDHKSKDFYLWDSNADIETTPLVAIPRWLLIMIQNKPKKT